MSGKYLKKRFLFLFLFLALLLSGYWIHNLRADYPNYTEGLGFLKAKNLTIYANYNGFYRLDNDTGKWVLVIPDVQGHLAQEVDLSGEYLYYFDRDDFCLKRTSTNANKHGEESVVQTTFIPEVIAMSQDGTHYALAAHKKIYVGSEQHNYYLLQKTDEPIVAMCWGLHNRDLYVSYPNRIVKIDVDTQETVDFVNGTGKPFCTEQFLIYKDFAWKNILKKTFECNDVQEIYHSEKILFGFGFSDSSNSIVFCHRIKTNWINWGVSPFVLDLDEGKIYGLPIFHSYTECFFVQ
jgi:hypothetical protein